MRKKIMTRVAAVGIAAAATLGVSGTAAAGPPDGAGEGRGKPAGIECMQSGIGTLQGAGLLPAVAKGGLPVQAALDLGVTVRPGMEDAAAGVPDPIPFNVVLADHRAGSNSIFVYPWC